MNVATNIFTVSSAMPQPVVEPVTVSSASVVTEVSKPLISQAAVAMSQTWSKEDKRSYYRCMNALSQVLMEAQSVVELNRALMVFQEQVEKLGCAFLVDSRSDYQALKQAIAAKIDWLQAEVDSTELNGSGDEPILSLKEKAGFYQCVFALERALDSEDANIIQAAKTDLEDNVEAILKRAPNSAEARIYDQLMQATHQTIDRLFDVQNGSLDGASEPCNSPIKPLSTISSITKIQKLKFGKGISFLELREVARTKGEQNVASALCLCPEEAGPVLSAQNPDTSFDVIHSNPNQTILRHIIGELYQLKQAARYQTESDERQYGELDNDPDVAFYKQHWLRLEEEMQKMRLEGAVITRKIFKKANATFIDYKIQTLRHAIKLYRMPDKILDEFL